MAKMHACLNKYKFDLINWKSKLHTKVKICDIKSQSDL